MMSPIPNFVDAIYIINLPDREDRRYEMAEQLARIGLDLEHSKVTVFPAHRPDTTGGFDSIGAHGCFLSHLDVLRDAKRRDFSTILLLEDDADFSIKFVEGGKYAVSELADQDWAFTYLGHHVIGRSQRLDNNEGIFFEVPWNQSVTLAHAILFRSNTIAGLIPYLEAMLTRAPGDPDGGPMHVDGAYSWFRQANPQLKTLASREQWIVQRASRTDIHETGWKEHVPLINQLRKLKNKFRL